MFIAALLLAGSSAFAADGTIGDDFHLRDQDTGYYTKSNGSFNWIGPWVEFSDSNSLPFSDPTTNAMQITGGNDSKLQFGNGYGESTMLAGKSIVRALDLEGKENIVLTFDFTRTSQSDYGDRLDVQMWDNSVNDWQVIAYLTSNQTYTIDITAAPIV